jgi:hypothetical protein
MGNGDGCRAVAGGAVALRLVVLLMATLATNRGIHGCETHRLAMAVDAVKVSVTFVPEGDGSFTLRLARGGDADLDRHDLGKAPFFVASRAVAACRILVMADLAAARRFEREFRP